MYAHASKCQSTFEVILKMIVQYESKKLRPNLKMLFLTNPYTSAKHTTPPNTVWSSFYAKYERTPSIFSKPLC